MKQLYFLLSFLFLISACATSTAPKSDAYLEAFKSCAEVPLLKKQRSEELQQIVNADQEDRKNWQTLTPEQNKEVVLRDKARIKRVGEIFGEGCITTPEDYAAAALVFQHGDTPDHFYQVFLWSKRGVDLGDKKQKSLMALGLDRYLTRMGKKELFASQAHIDNGGCACLEQVEHSFPDKLRVEYTGKSLSDALKWVDSLNTGKKCPKASECAKPLQKTPKGSIPGFW